MAKYRKKPVVIEAVQLRWDTWNEMCEHAGVGRLEDGKPQGSQDGEAIGLDIPTLEGLMHADENDWIIRGIKGEIYPCKPDVFDATYEKVYEELRCSPRCPMCGEWPCICKPRHEGTTLHNHVMLDGQVISEKTVRVGDKE